MAGFIATIGNFVGGEAAQTAGGVFGPMQRDLSYTMNMLNPNHLPSPDAIIAAYQRGFLDRDQARGFLAVHGVQFSPVGDIPAPQRFAAQAGGADIPFAAAWTGVAKLGQSWISPEETLVCLNRGIYSLREARDNLTRLGMLDDAQAAKYMSLRFQIPGASDLISFAVKEAWDANVIQRFRYLDEFPPEFQFWMERQGFGGDARTEAQLDQGAPRITWPQIYWATHWQNVSPTQAYEMFQRLRPERIDLYRRTLPHVQPFTAEDLEAILKVNDYAPPFRDQLAAIAYNKPRLVDIQRFYKLGLIDAREVNALHLDYGYPPHLAEMRTRFVVESAATDELKKLKPNPVKAILKSYGQGQLTRTQAALQIYRFAVAGTAGAREFGQMPPAAQLQLVESIGPVQAILAQFELEQHNAQIDRFLKRIKRRYQRGMLSRLETRVRLGGEGFQPSAIDDLMNEWDQELQSGKLLASTAMIRRWVLKQILPVTVAETWLSNLGWRDPEIQAIMVELQRDLSQEFARAQEKMARTAQQRQAALARQAKAAQQERNRVVQKMLMTMSPQRAHRYYVRGIIQESELRQALQKFDFTGTALENAVKDAKIDREAYLAKRAKERAAQAKLAGGAGSNGKAAPAAPTP